MSSIPESKRQQAKALPWDDKDISPTKDKLMGGRAGGSSIGKNSDSRGIPTQMIR